jgi:hypothetical protein
MRTFLIQAASYFILRTIAEFFIPKEFGPFDHFFFGWVAYLISEYVNEILDRRNNRIDCKVVMFPSDVSFTNNYDGDLPCRVFSATLDERGLPTRNLRLVDMVYKSKEN